MIEAKDLKIGMGVKLWYGQHTILSIVDYDGPFINEGCFAVMKLSNGSAMTLWENQTFEAAQ